MLALILFWLGLMGTEVHHLPLFPLSPQAISNIQFMYRQDILDRPLDRCSVWSI